MSSDVFRRVGRGGAGNFYSQKDVEDAENARPKDLEAQQQKTATSQHTTTQATSNSAPAYSRAGRGGAGNFYEAGTISESIEREQEVQKTKAAVAASGNARSRGGLTGRGGMGNWADDSADVERVKEEEKKKEVIEAKILEDVEAGLKLPAKAYHQHDREVE